MTNPPPSLRFLPSCRHSITIWGKLCRVLFYSFVGLQMVGAVWSQWSPTAGWSCLWDDTVQPTDRAWSIATVQSVNIWILGFFVYAMYGGIALPNVGLVWIIYLVQWRVYRPAVQAFLEEQCPDELSQLQTAMIVTIVWISLALLCALLNACRGKEPEEEAGTEEEDSARAALLEQDGYVAAEHHGAVESSE